MVLLFATARVAAADRTHVSSANDVCSPTADPCVINEVMTVDPPGDLDFGLRDVVVAAGGRLRIEQATIRCGSFKVEGPELRTGIVFLDTDLYGSLHVVAAGRCSQSPATGCFEDLSCAYGMGTCAGKGTIEIGAEIEATRHQGPDIEFAAAGDILLGSDIIMRATGPGGDGGGLTAVSHSGDVHIAGPVAIRQADPQGGYYGSDAGYPGELYVMAFRDIDVSAAIEMSGADEGGSVSFLAGRDVTVRNNITHDALPGRTPGTGGLSIMNAGRHVIVEPHGPNDDVTLIRSNGGSHLYQDGYYSFFEGGHGGITGIDADSFIVRNKSGFQSDSPRDDCADGDPYGGNFYIYSNNFLVDGPMTARGTGRCGTGGKMFFYTYADGAIGSHGSIDTSATNGGNLYFNVHGNLDLLGTVDTRGDTFTYWSDGYASFEGAGGIVQLHGDDLTVGGHVLLGGAASGTDFSARTCRLRLTPTSLIDARCLQPGNCAPAWTAPWFSAGQSVIADPGSRVLADSPMSITYGNAHQPPALDGTFSPPPVLDYDPWALDDCPPCGNGEVEDGETCDDWNVTNGDGCNSECVNEHCIAQTDDYLSTGLCYDGSSCTHDRCDPLANACVHEPACVDEFDCTLNDCVDDVCLSTPVDELCDDRNACTTDLCNASTGCVHADLIGVPCNDNDICTGSSACEEAIGCASTDPHPALGGRMTIDLRASANDLLVATLDVPAGDLLQPVTETGVTIHLEDDVRTVLIDTMLPGAVFTAGAASDFDYRFDDPQRAVALAEGVTALNVRRKSPERVTVQLRVKRDDLDAARDAATLGAFKLSVAFGAQPASDTCATLALSSCRVGRKIVCRG